MNLPQVIAAMRAAGLSDAEILKFVGSVDEERRAKAREGNRRRQAQFRERHRDARNGSNGVTGRDEALPGVTGRDASCAPAFSMGEDSTIPPVSPNGLTAPKGADDAKRGTRLSPDWKADSDDREYGRKLGFTDEQIDWLEEEFRNFWLGVPGARGRKLDWRRTFRNRLIDRAGLLKKGAMNGRPAKRPLADYARDLCEDVAAAVKEREARAALSLPDYGQRSGPPTDRGLS